MKKVAIVGTVGVPANYGGFESLVENIIGENCSPEIKYTIFCSSRDMPDKRKMHKGCRLKYIPLHANGIQSIPYDIFSMLQVVRGYDTILVLGTSGCIFLPVLKRLSGGRIIVNIDGIEHRREKWGKWARRFLRWSEAMAVRHADVIIADNKGIKDYVADTYHRRAVVIAYGGDHAVRDVPTDKQREILDRYGLEKGRYAVSVCRIEPENNCHISLEAFSECDVKFVFVGNWQHSEYARNLKSTYEAKKNIILLDSIYDLDVLYTLRSNAGWYIHGHSAGGTNPSLVEAMFLGCPILAYSVVYNWETTAYGACFFRSSKELRDLLLRTDLCGEKMVRIAKERYTWKRIARQYEELY